MGNKDKILGGIIMVVGIALIFFYTVLGPIDRLCMDGARFADTWLDSVTAWRNLGGLDWEIMVILPIWLLVVLIGLIAAWIGFSMLTTPPPVPLEELEAELEAEEAGSA